jgi:hypothetical protein
MWLFLKDGTPVHVTMARHGEKMTQLDVEALRELAEASRRKAAEVECVTGRPPDPPMVLETQWPNKPCHPLAIHDEFPAIGEPRPTSSSKP